MIKRYFVDREGYFREASEADISAAYACCKHEDVQALEAENREIKEKLTNTVSKEKCSKCGQPEINHSIEGKSYCPEGEPYSVFTPETKTGGEG